MKLPIILGHEGAGEVIEVGEGVDRVALGDHVVSCFIYMCAGSARYCAMGTPGALPQSGQSSRLHTLPGWHIAGTHDERGVALNIFSGCGVMAEYATVAVDNVVKIDSAIPLACAALVGCAVTTGVGAVFNTARVSPGSSVAVFGCGGIGLNVIQGARIAGAGRIVAIDTLQPKLEMAKQFGATDTLLAKPGEDLVKPIKKLTGGGADYAFECVGSGELAALGFRAIGRGGTAIVVGVAKPSDTTSVRTLSLPFEEKTLTGSYFGSCVPRVDYPRLLGLYMAGRLKLEELITHRYPIDEAPQAFADLESGKNARGVITF